MRAVGSVLRVLIPACVAFLALQTGAALAAVTEWPQATSDLKANPAVTFGQLPNGLRYAIRHNATPPGEVSMRLVIEAGSMQETASQEGLAHLIEHMAFRGSTHLADGEIMKTLQRLGSSPGADANAATGATSTTYIFNLNQPDGQTVGAALGFLREIASELSFSQAALDTERNVVLAEGRQRNTPDFEIGVAHTAALLPGHPYARPPIGRVDVVEQATPAQLRAFYDAYYRPERAVVVVVGDVDAVQVEAKIKALFADWRGRGRAGQDPAPYAPAGPAHTVVVKAQAGASRTALEMDWTGAYSAPDLKTRAGLEDQVVRTIGRRALTLRIMRMAAESGQPFSVGGMGTEQIWGVARSDNLSAGWVGDLPATIRILTTARRQVMADGLTQAEVDYVVQQARAELQRAAEGKEDVSLAIQSPNRAARLAYEATQDQIDLDEQQTLEVFDAAVKGLTAARVSEALRASLASEPPLVFLAAGATPPADQAALEKLLASAEAAPLAPYQPPRQLAWAHTSFGAPGAVVERREVADLGVTMARFANGVRLTVKPLKTAPGQAQVVVRFGHGRLDQPRDRLDSSDWSMSLMNMGGLDDLRFDEVVRALAGHRVVMLARTDDDAFVIGTFGPLTVPVADLDLELQYLAATMTTPGWRSDGWKTQVASSSQDYLASDSTPGGAFDVRSASLLHPGDQRFVRDTPDDIARFTPAAARAFIEPILAKGDIEVLVVGDVAPDQAIAAVGKTLGALPKRAGAPEPAGARDGRFPAPTAQPVMLEHKGPRDQGIAEISWPTTDEHAAWGDIAPTVIMADILRQRATDRLRTAEGKTYTPVGGATFSRVFRGWGRIALRVDCEPEEVPRIYAEIDAIAADLASKPVSDDELQRAIRPEIEGATRSQQQLGYWTGQLAGAQTNPDRLEYIRQTLPRLTAVTAADVQRVAKRWLKADRAFRIEVTPAPEAAAKVAAG